MQEKTLLNATGINGKQKEEKAVGKIYGITRGIGTTIAHPIRSIKEIAAGMRKKAKEKGESYVGGYILGEVTQMVAAAGAAAAAGKGLKGAKAAKKTKLKKGNGLADAGSKSGSDALQIGKTDLDEIWARRNIKSPANTPLFTRHAEEVLANDFDRAVIEAGINPQDVSGVLKIHRSNPTGCVGNAYKV